jgi:predicted nucleic acid-binding protein
MVIDTGIFIEHLRARDKSTTTLFGLADEPELFISAVSLYELYMGATSKEKMQDVGGLIQGLTVLPFTDEVALKAGQIYHQLRTSNKLIEFRDIFIAATCLTFNLPIATLNKKHFRRIDGLRILR